MDIKQTVESTEDNLLALVGVAVKANDFSAAHLILQALETARPALKSLLEREDVDLQHWGLTESERGLVKAGSHIDAVKAIRVRTQKTLRGAKDLADAYREHLYKIGAMRRP